MGEWFGAVEEVEREAEGEVVIIKNAKGMRGWGGKGPHQ